MATKLHTELIKLVQRAVGTDPDGKWGARTDKAVIETMRRMPGVPQPLNSVVLGPPGDRLIDPRSAKTIETLDKQAQNQFIELWHEAQILAREKGLTVKFISGHRTWKQQDALYAKGRTKPGPKVTNARGGYSNHNFGIAVDLGVFKGGRYLDNKDPKVAIALYRELAPRAKKLGVNWGGNWTRFKDYPHFEIDTGLTTAQKRAKYKAIGSVLG